MPVGGIVLSATKGSDYGLLAWSVDPDTNLPTAMRVIIPNVAWHESGWNHWWDDMPNFTGTDRHESLVYLAQLPKGDHVMCFEGQDPQSGTWVRFDCRYHTVK